MAKVVNLNRFRKQKAKVEREKRAETNKRLHGRTKAERLLELKQKQLLDAKVDGARLSTPPVRPGRSTPGPSDQHE
jgi:Domain of unknown function (DUF4169)